VHPTLITACRRVVQWVGSTSERRKKGLAQRATEWRQAAEIRAYVHAVRNSPELKSDEFDAWALRALQYADELDPITSNRATQLEFKASDAEGNRRYEHPNFSGWRPW